MTPTSAGTPEANSGQEPENQIPPIPDVSPLSYDRFPNVRRDDFRAADGTPSFIVPAADIVEILRFLREQNGFTLMEDLTAIDWRNAEPRFQVVYNLLALNSNATIRLKVGVSGSDPQLPSVTSVFPGANWYECEVYDLFGIVFSGHPDLHRIEMPEDWEGHPLRKDYPVTGPRRPNLPSNSYRPVGRGDVAG